MPLLYAALLFCFGALTIAAVFHLPLVQEGATVYFEVFSHYRPYFDPGYLRLFDALLHWPAVLYLKTFQPIDLAVPTLLLDLPYMLHPMASLAAVIWILRREGRLELLIFPMLGLATATLPTIAFPANNVSTALSLFWPLFFLVRFPARRPLSHGVGVALLSALLALTHESAVFLFGTLIVAAYKTARAKPALKRQTRLAGGLAAAALAFLFYRVVVRSPAHSNFLQELMGRPANFRIYTFAALAIYLASLYGALYDERRRSLWLRALLAGPALGALAYLFATAFYLDLEGSLARGARVTAAPFAAVIAFCALAFEQRLKRLANERSPALTTAAASAALLTIVASIYVGAVAFDWSYASSLGQVYVLENPGCHFIAETPIRKFNVYTGAGAFPGISIVLQQSRLPRSIIFERNPACAQEPAYDPCKHHHDGAYWRACGYPIDTAGSHFEFSSISAGSAGGR